MPRRTVAKHGPHPVDAHVGSRVRQRRKLLGMGQEQLGEALGLSYQQVQKYERGTDRISASRLYQLSQIFDVPVSFFFDEPIDEAKALQRDDVLLRRETLELVRTYYRIRDPAARKHLRKMTKAMANLAQG